MGAHNLSEFFADTEFTHRTPSAMANFGLDSIRFNAINSATITVNDAERDSDRNIENSDNDGSGHEYGNFDNIDSYGEEIEEYQGAQYLSSDTAERRLGELGKTFGVKNYASVRPHSDSS